MALKSSPENQASFSARARAWRCRLLDRLLSDAGLSGLAVIDIGGTCSFWEMNGGHFTGGAIDSVDVINLSSPTSESVTHGISLYQYQGDALDLSTCRRERYDLVFSNSVIEHVGNLDAQRAMANGIMRLADHYFVQTPCRWFPIEPHFGLPWFDLMPLGLRTWLLRRFRLGHMPRQPEWIEARIVCENTRLLGARELRALFTDGQLIREWVLCFVKSYMMTNIKSVSSRAGATQLQRNSDSLTGRQ